MFSTLAEMFVPRFNDFIFVFLYDLLRFDQHFRIKTIISGQRHYGFQPEFCFTFFTCNVNVDSIFFIGKKIKTIPLLSK